MGRELLRVLAPLSPPPTIQVAEADGALACRIQVWSANRAAPPAERRRPPGQRDECRADILEVVRAAGRPLTRKEVVRDLKLAGKSHGPSTVAKALADLTAAGALVNPKDKKGYRLPGWQRSKTPSLFD